MKLASHVALTFFFFIVFSFLFVCWRYSQLKPTIFPVDKPVQFVVPEKEDPLPKNVEFKG